MKINSALTSMMRHPTPRCSRPFWLVGLVLALLAGGAGLATAQTGIPKVINYQGKLTDNLGNPVPAGPYEITFKIWNSQNGETDADYIWGSSFPVNVVTNGLFNVLLTDGVSVGNPRTTHLLEAFEAEYRYLGLTITKAKNDPVFPQVEIKPRQRLASAPFAVHSYNASYSAQASNSITASNAAFASYANFATNASKFSNYNTNDFLMVNKAAQNLNGSLTISNGALTLRSNLVVSGSSTNSGDLTVGGSVKASGNVAISGRVIIGAASTHASNPGLLEIESRASNTPALRLSSAGPGHGSGVWLENRNGAGSRTNTWAIYSHANEGNLEFRNMEQDTVAMSIHTNRTVEFNPKPIVIRQYHLPDMPPAHVDAQTFTCTNFGKTDWSAAVVGVHVYADIDEEAADRFMEFRMVRGSSSPYWQLKFDLNSQDSNTDYPVQNIVVDVMFIRKEWVDDPDR